MAKKKLSPAPGQMAYLNKEFMESDAGRPLRILSEFYEPQQVFEQEEIKNSINHVVSILFCKTIIHRQTNQTVTFSCGILINSMKSSKL